MRSIPKSVHIINFLIKYLLFIIVFFTFNRLKLISFPNLFLFLLPLFFTLVGIIADWVVVPKFHNLPSALMGTIFMGGFTFLFSKFFSIGNINVYASIKLAFFLGIVEVLLHHLIVKPFLRSA